MSNPIVFVYLIYTFGLGQIQNTQALKRHDFTWLFQEKLETSLTTLLALNQEEVNYSFNKDDFPNEGITINAKIIPHVFIEPINKIRNDLGYKSKVPIILPSKFNSKGNTLHAYIVTGESGYQFTFAGDRFDVCARHGCWGSINGNIKRDDEMSLDQELEFFKERFGGYKRNCITFKCSSKEIEKTRQKVETAGFKILPRDIQGLYTPSVCLGVNCDHAKIQWDVGEYRYTVRLTRGTLEDVLEMANSAIENQQ